jgi:SAM-dependent methyltransferase
LKWVMDAITAVCSKKKSIKTNTLAYILEKLYRTIDGVSISHAERDRLQINDTSFIYGEISYEGFSEVLASASPSTNEIIYDLGSGTGKAIICAALLYDWKKCVGVEFLPGLYDVSQALLKNFLNMEEVQQQIPAKNFPIEFVQDDFQNVDFSDGDIIHVNATTLNPVLWGKLEMKLNQLKSGARVIVSTKKLDAVYFEKIYQAMLPMSWGDCTVFIYKKL